MSKTPFAPETFKTQNTRFLKVMLTNIFSGEKNDTDNFSFVQIGPFLSPPMLYQNWTKTGKVILGKPKNRHFST
jgi:hypothetical protein